MFEQSQLKPMSRVQRKNRTTILSAALEVFSQHGFRGTTLEQIASKAKMSKPNVIYYYASKEDIFVTLLNEHIDKWLAPLREIDPKGAPLEQILTYIRRKLEMSRDMPRESRLFANEIVQGAPRMKTNLSGELKTLFDRTCALFEDWMNAGHINKIPADHLIYSIWATTQHYADFEAQIDILSGTDDEMIDSAHAFLETLYKKLLSPDS